MSSESSQQEGSSSLFQQFFRQFAEEGLAGILILGGIILFLLPVVPITQIAGVVFLILGIIVWFVDWLWG
jgi:hypothetical protein